MNRMYIKFNALSSNEGFARTATAAFLLPLNPSVEEINDIKVAVSEAVTNAVVHAYPSSTGDVELTCWYSDFVVNIEVKDFGVGINDVDLALEPFYTTKEIEERSGMGFTVMRTFMDEFKVTSAPGEGVTINMKKRIAPEKENNA